METILLIINSGLVLTIVGFFLKKRFYNTEVVAGEQKNELSKIELRRHKQELADELEEKIVAKSKTLIEAESEKISMRMTIQIKDGIIKEKNDTIKEIYVSQGEMNERVRQSEERERECQKKLMGLQLQIEEVRAR